MNEVMRLIELTGIGIHRCFKVPVLRGRVVELVGTNGVGKSTAIDAFREWLGADVHVERSYDEDRGQVECEGSGFRRFAKQRRTFGSAPNDLGFVAVEERFDMMDLIEPKLKKAEDRDRVRIKAQLSLSRAKIDFKEFEALIPPRNGHEPINIEKARKADDPVQQAAIVKRALEEEARRYEGLAAKWRDDQRVAIESVKAVDVSVPHDRAVLQAQHEAAVTRVATLREQVKAAEEAKKTRAAAELQIQEAGATYRGPTIPEATASLEQARAKADAAKQAELAAKEAVRAAEEALRIARAELCSKTAIAVSEQAAVRAAEQTLQAAGDHESLLANLTGQFTADLPQAPEPATIVEAESVKAAAEQAVLAGEKARVAIAKRSEAEELGRKAAANEAWAARLREAGKATDEVLNRALKSPRLRVMGDRLVYRHDSGQEEEFDVLSRGQRSIAAIQEAARGVTEEGDGTRVLLFPQEIWEGLAPENRDAISDTAAIEDLCIVTGRVQNRDAGEPSELHVRVYGEGIWNPATGEVAA